MLVKVCGMRDSANIAQVHDAGADMIGFIFYDKSKRYAGAVPPNLQVACKRVGVFVNSHIDNILSIADAWALDYIQLHGDESPEYCDSISLHGLKVIKAISVEGEAAVNQAYRYEGRVDMLLFDTKCQGYGGSGELFEWDTLHNYNGATPFLLSGGIGPDSIDDVLSFRHPRLAGIDINSRFEISPGIKDISLVKKFIKQLKQ